MNIEWFYLKFIMNLCDNILTIKLNIEREMQTNYTMYKIQIHTHTHTHCIHTHIHTLCFPSQNNETVIVIKRYHIVAVEKRREYTKKKNQPTNRKTIEVHTRDERAEYTGNMDE